MILVWTSMMFLTFILIIIIPMMLKTVLEKSQFRKMGTHEHRGIWEALVINKTKETKQTTRIVQKTRIKNILCV